jgi:hypothetical protein
MQHTPAKRAGGQSNRAIEGGQGIGSATREGERDTEGAQHISFALGRANLLSAPQSTPELADACANVANVAQDYPGGLVRDQRAIWAWASGKDAPSLNERVPRTGHCQ